MALSPQQPDPLAVIEGINAIAGFMDSMKQALTDRGWTPPVAEHAAIAVYQMQSAQQAALAAQQGPQGDPQ